jgi:protoporphyrinogen oxidase
MKICIIGAGATGLSAGYELSKKGHDITILESEKQLGGLVKSVTVGEEKLEMFYHHIFTNDTDIIELIEELGLSPELMWIEPKNGIYINKKFYPFTSPMDLLMFKELSFIERIRMGLLVFKAKFVKDWKDLEDETSKDWIIKNAGQNVYEKVWGPLINSKFDFDSENIAATWIWNKFKLRGSTRGKNINKEMLGYMKGSFSLVYEKLVEKITEQGGKILSGTTVNKITPKENNTLDVSFNNASENFDRVLITTAPDVLNKMDVPLPEFYTNKLSSIKYKANICMILELSEKLSPFYWLTIADDSCPFVLMIEHTNLVPVNGYKSHVVYLSRYLDEKNEMYSLSDEEVKKQFLNHLKILFPQFDESKLINTHINRARYSQPVVVKKYSKILPEIKTPVENLYLASMAQIYPEDRGQSYSVRLGKKAAKLIIND